MYVLSLNKDNNSNIKIVILLTDICWNKYLHNLTQWFDN